MGFLIELEELKLIIEKVKSNLLYLSLLKKDQIFKINASKDKQTISDQNSPINESFKRNFVYYSDDFKKFISCEINYTNCKNLNLNSKDISELLRQNLSYDQTSLIYMGRNLLGSSSKNFYYKNYDEIIKKKFDTKKINNEINIFYNKKTNINIFEDKKEIYIKNFGQEKVVFFDSILKGWSIFFSKDQVADEINDTSNFTRSDEFGLTGCLTFLNSTIYDLKLKIENMECEDSVNFIKTNGDVEELKIKNSEYDGVDADFSQIDFNNIDISNSGNDCIDFSYGEYKIRYADLNYCNDKAISSGEKSLLNVDQIMILNSNIGIASKDSSKVFIEDAKMKNTNNCLTSYKKKQEFWGGYIFSNKVECSNSFKFTDKDQYSEIIINNSIKK